MTTDYWRPFVGPLVTFATVAGIYIVDRYFVPIPNPGAISFAAVVFSASIGGIAAGLASTLISLGYATFSLSLPEQFLQFRPDDLARLGVLVVTTPLIAVMVGLLQQRARRWRQHDEAKQIATEAANHELVTLRASLGQIDYGIVLLDSELRVGFANPAFRRMWHVPDDLMERRPAFVALLYRARDNEAFAIHADEVDAFVAQRIAQIRAGDEQPLDIGFANGDVICMRCKVLPDGGRMLTFADVTARASRTRELEQLATIDGLTGINNRRHFLALAEGEWSRHARYGRPFALLLFDIDYFKSVNDAYGHAVGDTVIRDVAGILQTSKRASDIAGRIGGEEFTLLLPEATVEGAGLTADRMRKAIAGHRVLSDGHAVTVTVSIGVTVTRDGMTGIGEMMRQADMALYHAKRTGRNRACTFDQWTRTDTDAPEPLPGNVIGANQSG
jgi:diguanylate cyclase (GGDEF)-like protein